MRRLAGRNRVPGHRWLMTIQITAKTTRKMIREAYRMGIRVVKYYPAGVTTNSENGVSGWWEAIMAALEEMARLCEEHPDQPMVLQVHAEEGFDEHGKELDPWLREYRALPQVRWLALRLPHLVISFEHVSTDGAVDLGIELPNLLLSISIVHMTLTREDVVDHAHHLNPHCWCAPVAKDEPSRKRLVAAATGQIPELADRVHLGLDYAPHLIELKEAREWTFPPGADKKLPPMGAYSLPEAVPLLVALFERTVAGGPDVWTSRLLKFGRTNGPRNYGVTLPNRRHITLVREPSMVPNHYVDHEGVPTLRSFMAGREVSWKVIGARL